MHTEVFYQVGYEAQTFFDKVGLFRRERPGPIKVTKRSDRKYVLWGQRSIMNWEIVKGKDLNLVNWTSTKASPLL